MYRLASVNTTSLLRCLGALVALIALVLLGGAGLPSVAFAADSDPSPSMTVDIKLVIYDNETSDLTVSMKVEGTPASLYCTEALLDNNDSFEVKADGDTCTLGLYGADIDDVEGGAMSIEHKGGTYTAKISDFKDFKDSKNTTVTMIFPGEVIDADTNAEVKGNTVTWSNVTSLDSVRAEGRDTDAPTSTPSPTRTSGNGQNQSQAQNGDQDGGSSLLPLWIVLGAVAIVAITATVVTVVMNNSKKQLAIQGAHPGAPQFGQSPMPQYPIRPDYPGQPPRATQQYSAPSTYAPPQTDGYDPRGYDPQRHVSTQQFSIPQRSGYDPNGQQSGARPEPRPYEPRQGYDPNDRSEY